MFNVTVAPAGIACTPVAPVLKTPAVEPAENPFCATVLVSEAIATALIAVGWLLVIVIEIAGNIPTRPCDGSVVVENVNDWAVGTGGTETTSVNTLGVPWLSIAVMFTALEPVADSRTENVHTPFAAAIPTLVGDAPAFQLTVYWIWAIWSGRYPSSH